MIAIVNVSKELSALGWHDYEVRINQRVITTFKHKREEGLSKCLIEASKAVEIARSKEVIALTDLLTWDGQGDPPGNWIKRKGLWADTINPKF